MAKPVVRPYRSTDAAAWNAFNASAMTGHFLFDRRFMEYHADRFTDASLLIEEEGVIQGLLPANRVEDTVYSHQGLTFGGLVTADTSTPATMRRLDAITAWFRQQGATRMVYKALPSIYHRQPAASDLYWLIHRWAILVRRDITTTIDYRQQGMLSSRRLRGVRKAARMGLTMGLSNDVGGFWNLLAQVLHTRHQVTPVHTLEELTLLISRLPENIRLFTTTHDNQIVAGVLIFETDMVAHAQYIATSDAGRDLGALDGLLDLLIRHYASSKRFFDFGISTEQCGRLLNEGLITQKEEFGGGALMHDVYELDLSTFAE
jgi:Acetyltransferase (GNAT) domain